MGVIMKINVVAVGNLKEKYLLEGCKEYLKRISRYHNINVVEIEEEKLPKNYSEGDIAKCLIKEGQKIEKHLVGYIVILDRLGEMLDSIAFAKKIENISLGNSAITFVIGGSYGISENIKSMANYSISFSKMTFPHQLFREMLLEQIYRACTITNNVLYHK